MPRAEKVQAVAEIRERIEGAQAVFLAEYAGLSVKDQQVLRRSLKQGGAEFKVVKMSLARLAADELDIETLDELLLGPTGLAFADEDVVAAAKALKDFAKSHDVFIIKGGVLGNDFLTPERVSELADVEPREVLLAKIAGAAKAPLANLAEVMAALPRNFASMLLQLVEGEESDVSTATDEAMPPSGESETPSLEGAEQSEPAAGGDDAGAVSQDTADAEDETGDESDQDAAVAAEEE